MSTVLVQALQFVLALSLLVTIHELGHFLAARMFGIRVDKFYLFFNPWFSLYKRKIGDVEFGIGWLPLGGYVSIYDSREKLFDAEARAKDELKRAKSELKKSNLEAEKEICREKIAALEAEIKSLQEQQRTMQPEPNELRAKPAWQRLIVMIAGVFMNVVAAILIYAGILFAWGEGYYHNDDAEYGYVFNDTAKELGFEDGDKFVAIDGERVENIADASSKLIVTDSDHAVTVLRNGVEVDIDLTLADLVKLRNESEATVQHYNAGCAGAYFFRMNNPFVLDSVSDGASEAGLVRGDRVIAINDNEVRDYVDGVIALQNIANSDAQVTVVRNDADTLQLVVPVDEEARMGVTVHVIPNRSREYGFWESIPAGVIRCGQEIKSYWDQLVMMVNPDTELYSEVGGFISIGSVFPDTWHWPAFWSITALLSVILAVMNLLPIPVLDGGHVLFALWEIITRRKPNEKFMEIAQTIGFILLLLLLVYANGNDLLNLFK